MSSNTSTSLKKATIFALVIAFVFNSVTACSDVWMSMNSKRELISLSTFFTGLTAGCSLFALLDIYRKKTSTLKLFILVQMLSLSYYTIEIIHQDSMESLSRGIIYNENIEGDLNSKCNVQFIRTFFEFMFYKMSAATLIISVYSIMMVYIYLDMEVFRYDSTPHLAWNINYLTPSFLPAYNDVMKNELPSYEVATEIDAALSNGKEESHLLVPSDCEMIK